MVNFTQIVSERMKENYATSYFLLALSEHKVSFVYIESHAIMIYILIII